MSEAVRLSNPRLEVVLDDGRTLQVQVINPDLLRYDRTAAKHGWPTYNAKGEARAPFLLMTFLAWAALRRTGEIPDEPAWNWDRFSEERCVDLRHLTNGTGPAEEADVVDPTRSEAAPA